MAKYVSGRQKNLKVGISSYSENLTSLEVIGKVGINTSSPSYTLQVNGSFAATTKSFLIPHPTKENRKLRYASLEGPENGVYLRGRTSERIIELPDYWTKLIDLNSITVHLTPVGKYEKLFVTDIKDNKIFVDISSDVNFEYFYYIVAERIDVEKLEIEVD